jgi:cytochrome b561
MTAPARYPLRTRILHWLTAVLVFSMLLIGFAMVNSIGSYASLRAVHMTLGIIVLVIVVLRAANRLTHRVPNMPDTVGWVEHKLVVGSELTLYALLLAQPLVGWAMVSATGKPVVIFGSLHLPRIAPFNADLYFILRQTHSLLAYLLVAVIAAHVSAVLLHTLTLRDGMLSRMAFAHRRKDTRSNSASLAAPGPVTVHSAMREHTNATANTGRHGRTRRDR